MRTFSLKAFRVDANLTQEQMAAALNVSKKTVGAWESGKTKPTTDKIDAICELFDVCYDDIRWNV